VRRPRRRREGGPGLIRVSRSLPQMSMSQVAKEWDRLSKAEKERRRSLVVRHVYGGDAEAARPRTVGLVLLNIDRIIGDAPKPTKPTKAQKREVKPKPKSKPRKKVEKPESCFLVDGKTVGTDHHYAVVDGRGQVLMAGDDKLHLLRQYDRIEDLTTEKPKEKFRKKAEKPRKVDKPEKPKAGKAPKAEAPPASEFEAAFDKAFREALERKVRLYKPGLEGSLHYDAPSFEKEYAQNWTEETVLNWAAEDLDAFKEERLKRYREMTAENPEAAKYFFKRVNMWADKIAGDMARKTRDQMLKEAKIREEHRRRQRGTAKTEKSKPRFTTAEGLPHASRTPIENFKMVTVLRPIEEWNRTLREVLPEDIGDLEMGDLLYVSPELRDDLICFDCAVPGESPVIYTQREIRLNDGTVIPAGTPGVWWKRREKLARFQGHPNPIVIGDDEWGTEKPAAKPKPKTVEKAERPGEMLVGGYRVGEAIRLRDHPKTLFRVVGPAPGGGLSVETLGVKDSRTVVWPIVDKIDRVERDGEPVTLPVGADAYGYVHDIRPGHTGYVVSIRTDRGEFYRNLPTKEQAVEWAMKGRDTIEKMNYETGEREPRDVAWVPVTPPPKLPPHLKRFKNKRLHTVRVRDEPIYSDGRWVFPSDSGDRAAWTLEQLEQMHSEGQKALAERRERAKQSRTLERPRKAKDRRDWDRTVIPYTVLGEFANDRDAPYAHIKVEGGEVEVKGMDPSHVTLYRFRFPDPGLIPEGEYAIEETSTYYSSPLKHPTKVEWDAPDQTLRFHKGDYDAWFKLAPPETVGTEVPQPRLYYKARFRMMLKPLLKLARNAADDLANMKVEVMGRGKPMVKFSWTTQDALGRESSVEEMFEAGAGPDYPLISAEFLEGDDYVKAVYSPRYLVDFLERAKRMGLEAVTFEFNEDNPLHIEAGDAELEAEFWQAPLIGVD